MAETDSLSLNDLSRDFNFKYLLFFQSFIPNDTIKILGTK